MDGSEAIGGKDGKGFFLSLYESSHSTSNNITLRKWHGTEGPSPRSRLTSLQIIASGRVSAFSAVSSTDGGVFKQRTVQYLLAAAATFIRAVQMFDETGGTSAGNKRRHGFNVGPLLEFADVLLSKQQSNHPGAAAYKTSRPCTHPILCFTLFITPSTIVSPKLRAHRGQCLKLAYARCQEHYE